MKCKRCGSKQIVKNGKTKSMQQQYLCRGCGHHFINEYAWCQSREKDAPQAEDGKERPIYLCHTCKYMRINEF